MLRKGRFEPNRFDEHADPEDTTQLRLWHAPANLSAATGDGRLGWGRIRINIGIGDKDRDTDWDKDWIGIRIRIRIGIRIG